MKCLCIFIPAIFCILGAYADLDTKQIQCTTLAELLDVESEKDAYLPHEENCGEFYQCGKGGAAKFSCGEGAFFSIKTKICGHAENTRCVKLKDYLKKKNVKLESFYIDDYPDTADEEEEESSSVATTKKTSKTTKRKPEASKVAEFEPLGRAGPKYMGGDDDE